MAITDNLISWWELGEASGTRNDSHSTNHLTDNNTVLQGTGKVGNCADFENGNSEYLSKTDNAALSVANNDFTWCAWGWMESKIGGGAGQPLVRKGSGSTYEFNLTYDGDLDRLVFAVCSGAAFANETKAAANVLGSPAISTWYFIVGWHDSVGDVVGIQINNGTANTTACTTGSFDGASDLRIGGNSDNAEYWDGLIDQVGFWKRVLTTTEKTFLYNSGAGRSYASLLEPAATVASYRNFPRPILRQPIIGGRPNK